MTIEVELQIASQAKTLPHPAQFRTWVAHSLLNRVDAASMVIRVVDETEMTHLNERYRHKVGPTNVLSFPYEPMPGVISDFLGDIVICASIVQSESQTYNKPLLAYWAHMVVHGTLHLLGFDHEQEEEAHEMQELETEILLRLGFPPPYGDTICYV